MDQQRWDEIHALLVEVNQRADENRIKAKVNLVHSQLLLASLQGGIEGKILLLGEILAKSVSLVYEEGVKGKVARAVIQDLYPLLNDIEATPDLSDIFASRFIAAAPWALDILADQVTQSISIHQQSSSSIFVHRLQQELLIRGIVALDSGEELGPADSDPT